MSVESTIKSLLEESRKLKEATNVTEANRVTQGAVPAEGMQHISSPDKMGGENEDNKRNNVDDQPEAKGGTSKKPNPATQGATAPETMAKLEAIDFEDLDSIISEGLYTTTKMSHDDLLPNARKLHKKLVSAGYKPQSSTHLSGHSRSGTYDHPTRRSVTMHLTKSRDSSGIRLNHHKEDPYASKPKAKKLPLPEQMGDNEVTFSNTYSMEEDIDALFNGEDGLTEEFRQKAETIFEAAVVSRVKEEVARIEEQYSELVEERVEEIKEGLVDHIDGYLNLMVEQWMEQNEVALESGMKSDILENFVSGLKNLFAESYIEVPQEKFDVVADLEAKLAEATQKIDEVYALNVDLRKQVNEHARLDIIAQVSEGLSDLEVEKFTTLAEEIAFEDRETFAQKMQVIRENYFAKKAAKAGGADFLTEETIQEEKQAVPASMSQYVQAINMTVRK